ncbi:MAG TPA: tetratricopeptide repeat protein, partial [Pirellulales bacterium]
MAAREHVMLAAGNGGRNRGRNVGSVAMGFVEQSVVKRLREAEGYLDLSAALHALEARIDSSPRGGHGGSHQLAEKALESLAAISDPGRHRECWLYYRGMAYRDLGSYREAIVPLKEAASLDPSNIHVWLALGWCYKRIGRVDLAIEALDSARRVAPGEAIIQYNLACYWSLSRNKDLAMQFLRRALDLDPKYRDMIGDETDFDSLRADPEFQALVSIIV